jgi:hypothetical protein
VATPNCNETDAVNKLRIQVTLPQGLIFLKIILVN